MSERRGKCAVCGRALWRNRVGTVLHLLDRRRFPDVVIDHPGVFR